MSLDIRKMRRHHPFMGRAKLKVMLGREGLALSEATIGRILQKGVALGRVTPCAFCRGRVAAKRRRSFGGHARRWKCGRCAGRPGELVQIDHMSVSRDGQKLKEFKAVSPVGKQLVARVCSRATAGNARRFLQAVRGDLPHGLLSVQVDGGSEFMDDFERACRDLAIPLFGLPPRRPQFNGCVERANDTTRTELKEPLRRRPHCRAGRLGPRPLSDLSQQRQATPVAGLDDPNEYLSSQAGVPTQSHRS